VVNTSNHDEKFEQRARAAFEDSTERLDAATRSRLTQARYAALEAARAKPRWLAWTWGLPAGLAAMLAVTLLFNGRSSEAPVPSTLDDLPIVASENLDLLENVEFYAWLDDQEPTSADGAG
jgi:hypothetical protein